MISDSASAGGSGPGGFAVRTEDHDGAVVLSVFGDVDMTTAPDVAKSIEGALEHGPEVLVVDLSGVSFLASAGISVLIDGNRRAADRTRFRLVATGSTTLRPMELTGIAAEFSIHASRDQALRGG